MELPAAAGLEYLAAKPCEIFTTAKAIPQSLALSTLVTMEMLKALRCVLCTLRTWRVVRWPSLGGSGRETSPPRFPPPRKLHELAETTSFSNFHA